MKRWGGLAWMTTGVVLGALTMAVFVGALAVAPVPVSLIQKLPEPIMARLLLAREASTLSVGRSDVGGVQLLSRPDFAGGPLCKVRAYGFHSETIDDAGRPDVRVEELFGLWTDTIHPGNRADPAGHGGCPSYVDLDHLIRGAPEEILPAITAVDLVRQTLKRGPADFTVTCAGPFARGVRSPCDGAAYLRSLDLKKIQDARALGDPLAAGGPGVRSQFWLFVNDGSLHGHPQMTAVTITTEEAGHMQNPRVLSVAIDQQAY